MTNQGCYQTHAYAFVLQFKRHDQRILIGLLNGHSIINSHLMSTQNQLLCEYMGKRKKYLFTAKGILHHNDYTVYENLYLTV